MVLVFWNVTTILNLEVRCRGPGGNVVDDIVELLHYVTSFFQC